MIQIDRSERVVFLDGHFGDPEFGGISGAEFRQALDLLGAGDVYVTINSGGGEVAHAEGVVQALLAHNGHVVTIASGLCASAAVHVLLAGDDRIAIGTTMLMIHSASVAVAGPRRDLEDALDALRVWDQQAVEYFASRGIDRETAQHWHDSGRDFWFDPWEALEAGILTGVQAFEAPPAPATEGQRALADVERNSQIWQHKDRIRDAQEIMRQGARSKQEPRPAEKAATLRPESKPIAVAAQSERALRFDRWRRLQNLLDRQFEAALTRNRKIKALTGVELPRPKYSGPLETWRTLYG